MTPFARRTGHAVSASAEAHEFEQTSNPCEPRRQPVRARRCAQKAGFWRNSHSFSALCHGVRAVFFLLYSISSCRENIRRPFPAENCGIMGRRHAQCLTPGMWCQTLGTDTGHIRTLKQSLSELSEVPAQRADYLPPQRQAAQVPQLAYAARGVHRHAHAPRPRGVTKNGIRPPVRAGGLRPRTAMLCANVPARRRVAPKRACNPNRNRLS